MGDLAMRPMKPGGEKVDGGGEGGTKQKGQPGKKDGGYRGTLFHA